MVETTPSGIIVASCDIDGCDAVWVPKAQDLERLPHRCSDPRRHFKWNHKGVFRPGADALPAPAKAAAKGEMRRCRHGLYFCESCRKEQVIGA